MISSYIEAIIIAIQQKEFLKITFGVFVHSFCSLGMHVAINMIKEMHLFEGQKSLIFWNDKHKSKSLVLVSLANPTSAENLKP